MIKVTKLNKAEFIINAELIESLEATPDTHINLLNGKNLVVRESIDEVMQKIIEYRRSIRLVDRISYDEYLK